MQQTVQTTCRALVIAGGGPNLPAIRAAMSQRRLRVCLEDAAGAREALADGSFDLVVLDLQELEDAAELVATAKAHHPERPVVAIAGQDADESAAAGCDDVLGSPLSVDALADLLETLLPQHEVAMADSLHEHRSCQIAGCSPAFLRTVELARRVAPTSVPVLITGESGTGKELISHLIHGRSNRGRGPYVRVNCAAVSESLLESELFGHEKGAFTGAVSLRKGRFEQAHGGTLLLDEISETGPRLQAELLRVLEQQDFERVGGSDTVRVNVRIISTSNRDLSADVEAGRFRRDLYYRICGVHISAPPLRQRVEDLDVLVWHFVNLYSREVRRRITALDDGMMSVFRQYPWPGNVRQLRNVVRTAMILGQGPTLSLEHADMLLHELTLGVQAGMAKAQQAAAVSAAPNAAPSLSLQDVERKTILEALQRSQRNQAKAARLLGITDRTLREKLRRYRQDGRLETVEELTW